MRVTGCNINVTEMLLLLLWLPSLAQCGKFNEPSEFLRSFMTRPQLLPNSSTVSGPHRLRRDSPVVDVVVENWSPYSLVYKAHTVQEGDFDSAFPPRNLPSKRRSFAVRTTGDRGADGVGGMLGWTLVNPQDGMEVSRLTAAWDVKRGGGERQTFAVSLGDFVPDFDDAFVERTGGRLESKVGRETGRAVAVADLRTTAAARMTRRGEMHYMLKVTLVPQNVDIWFWTKYFKEEAERMAVTQQPKPPTSSNNNNNNKKKLEAHRKALPKVSKENNKRHEEVESRPLYDRPELLQEGISIVDLHDRGISSLREALRTQAKSHSVAVGIQIENWTRFKLGTPEVELDSGKLLNGGELLAPREVLPGRRAVAAIGNSGALKGAAGLIKWAVGSAKSGRVFHVMWSIPYNQQFWNSWAGVGVTDAASQLSYKDMYKGKDPRRFERAKSGREFEFSDGELIAMAFMDGGATSKPVLRVRLMPRDDHDLAAVVRRRLGMAVTRADDVRERAAAAADGAAPQVGQVMDSAANKVHLGAAGGGALFAFVLVSHMLLI